MSHIRETSKVTINTSYFHPAHQAQKAETVPLYIRYIIFVSGSRYFSSGKRAELYDGASPLHAHNNYYIW
jgi:hypothetical protein